MKNINALVLLLLLSNTLVYAQWKQSTGPGAGFALEMIAVGSDVYVANRDFTGTDGRVYRTTNFGNSWFAADNGLTNTYINAFAHIDNHIFAGVSTGVFRTDNAGELWVQKPASPYFVLSLLAKDGLLFSGQSGSGVYLSTNLGDTWTARNNGLPAGQVIVLDMERLGSYVFAGLASGGGPAPLYRTSNDGLSWTLSNSGLPNGANIGYFTVNGSTLFASIQGVGIFGEYEYGVYRSLDSGTTWAAVNNGIPEVVGGDPREIFAYDGVIYLSTTYPFGTPMVYKSTNNGDSWSIAGTGLRANQPAFSFAGAGNYVFAGLAQYASVFRTSNDGATWKPARKGLANSAVFSLLDQNGRIYSGSQEGLYYTQDDGKNWTEVQNGLQFGLPVIAIEKNGSNIYLGTDGWGMWRSADNGTTWTEINSGINGIFADYVNDVLSTPNGLFAATWDGVYKSTNNGNTWMLSSSGLPNGGKVNVKTLISSGGVLFAGTVLEKIYKSTDNGATWTFSGNGISTYASTIYSLLEVGTDLYAGTEDGIYKSANQGATWTLAGLGGPVKELAANGSQIYASAYGATILTGYGIYKSSNNGATWNLWDQGMNPNSSVRALLVYNGKLWAGTDTRSVWSRKLPALVMKEENNAEADVNISDDILDLRIQEGGIFSASATNPFTHTIDITLQLTDGGKAIVYLMDNAGRTLIKEEIEASAGTNNINLSGRELPQGIYLMKIIKGEHEKCLKLVK